MVPCLQLPQAPQQPISTMMLFLNQACDMLHISAATNIQPCDRTLVTLCQQGEIDCMWPISGRELPRILRMTSPHQTLQLAVVEAASTCQSLQLPYKLYFAWMADTGNMQAQQNCCACAGSETGAGAACKATQQSKRKMGSLQHDKSGAQARAEVQEARSLVLQLYGHRVQQGKASRTTAAAFVRLCALAG